MQKKNKVPNVTKVIIKDLKGERIVYQNADNGKIVIPRNKKNESYVKQKRNYTWDLAWRVLVVIFIIDFSLFSYFKFYKKIGFIEGINGWVISTRQFIHGNKNNNQTAVIQAKKSYYPNRQSYIPTKKTVSYQPKRKPT